MRLRTGLPPPDVRDSRAVAVVSAPIVALWACLCACSARGQGSNLPGQAAAVSSSISAAEMATVPIGLCEDYPEESRSVAEVRRDIALLRSAKVALLRVSIGWDGLEPEPDRYDFEFWDEVIAEMSAAGIRLIPYVAYTPRWASRAPDRPDFWKRPPADVRRFARVLGLLAARYRGRISSWEIWNEPDNPDFWAGSVGDYRALLAAGARAVRLSDPSAKVVFGGVAGHPQFAAEVLADPGLAGLVDVVNAHAYFETWNGGAIESLPAYLASFAPALRAGSFAAGQALTAGSGAVRSLWLAEVGYSAYRPLGDEAGGVSISPAYRARYAYEHTLDFQAVALVRTVSLALTVPAVTLLAWYEVKDPQPAAPMIGDDNNRHLGVAFSDWRPNRRLPRLSS